MSIRYTLNQSPFAGKDAPYCARVSANASANLEDVVERIMHQGSTVTRADVLAVLENALLAAEGFLLDGIRVNLGGLVELYPTVRGTFTSASDRFDQERHRVDISSTAGRRLRRRFRQQAEVIKADASPNAPRIVQFQDLQAGINHKITPGGMGVVSGCNLKFNPQAADEGLWFMPLQSGSPVKASIFQKIMPAQLVFQNPAILPPGPCRLEVHARVRGVKRLTTGTLDTLLTVDE